MRLRMAVHGALVTLMVMVAVPGSAQEEAELNTADRVLIHGYDPAAMQLLWATVLDPGAAGACALDGDQISDDGTYTYDIGEDGTVTVEGAEGECSFHATDVTGPEGQVNHGSVVSSFVRALKDSGYEGGVGCFVKLIAQSDYGKGDQQVTTGEAAESEEDGGETSATGDTTVELTVADTSCGKPDDVGQPEHDGNGNGNGNQGNGNGNGNQGNGNGNQGNGNSGKP